MSKFNLYIYIMKDSVGRNGNLNTQIIRNRLRYDIDSHRHINTEFHR